MSQQDAYLYSIRSAYPDLEFDMAEINAQGQNSDVVILDRRFVFRFPKYTHVVERLKTETAILEGIKGHLPLAVPEPLFISLESTAVGTSLVGYRLIPGEPLWRETFRTIESEEVVSELTGQLGAFLSALHSIDLDEELQSRLPLRDTYEETADIYARIRSKLFRHMRPDAQEWAVRHFEGFLSDPCNFDYVPVLRHGDFGPSNILYDDQEQKVTGIIDFSSAGTGDPAYDLAGLLSGYGEDFVVACGVVYPDVEEFMGRIRFYQGTFALLEALFGIENGDEEAFRAGLRDYV
jgi:aminoglycoside 2''-phosphotransferase